MGIGWEKPVFGWIQKLQIHIFFARGTRKSGIFYTRGEALLQVMHNCLRCPPGK